MREPFEDPSGLVFRSRPHVRTVRHGGQAIWIVVTLVAALLFVLIIRALLVRTSGTASGSVTRAPAAASRWEATSGQGAYSASAPTPDAKDIYPSTGMVYRCVGKRGEVALQSQPCGPDARMTWAIHAPAEREPPRRATSVVAPVDRVASSAQYAKIDHPSSVQDSRGAACAQAKRSREETLERVGLARTYDLLQRLDEMVNQACR